MVNDQIRLSRDELKRMMMGKLFVRCGVRSMDSTSRVIKPRMRTTIQLLTSSSDEDGNTFHTHIVYTDEQEADGDRRNWKPLVGLTVRGLPNGRGHELDVELDKILESWREEFPRWLGQRQVYACWTSDVYEVEITPTDRVLMQHYVRLETRLAYALESRDVSISPNTLCFIFYRVVSFLRDCNKDWARVVG